MKRLCATSHSHTWRNREHSRHMPHGIIITYELLECCGSFLHSYSGVICSWILFSVATEFSTDRLRPEENISSHFSVRCFLRHVKSRMKSFDCLIKLFWTFFSLKFGRVIQCSLTFLMFFHRLGHSGAFLDVLEYSRVWRDKIGYFLEIIGNSRTVAHHIIQTGKFDRREIARMQKWWVFVWVWHSCFVFDNLEFLLTQKSTRNCFLMIFNTFFCHFGTKQKRNNAIMTKDRY